MTNIISMKQLEKRKESLARSLKCDRKMSWHRIIVSGPLRVRGNDEMCRRLTSLKMWLAGCSSEQGFGFAGN